MKISRLTHSLLTNIGVVLISFLTGIVLARGLNVEDRGLLAEYFLFVNILLPLSTFGIYDTLITSKNTNIRFLRNVVSSSFITVIISSLVLVFLFEFKSYLLVQTLCAVVMLITNFLIISYQAILSIKGRIKDANNLRFVVPFSYFILNFIAFNFYNLSLEKVVLYNTMANVLCLCLARFYLKDLFKVKRRNVFRISLFFNRFKKTKWLAASAVFLSFSTKLDQLVISTFLDYNALAYFAIALSSTVVVVNFFTNTLISITYPKLSSFSEKDIVESTISILFISVVFYLISAFILSYLYPFIIPNFFGEKYNSSVSISQYMIYGGVFIFIRNFLNKKLKLLSFEKKSFYSDLLPCLCLSIFIATLVIVDVDLDLKLIVFLAIISNFISSLYPVYLLIRKAIALKVKFSRDSLFRVKAVLYG